MKLLDLFCGEGGCSMGYHWAGFEVIGVDCEPKPRYPFKFIQADALTFPLDEYDVIHASPPCQHYSNSWTKTVHKEKEYPDLLLPIRERLIASGKPYIIENVPGSPLLDYIILCGSMFDLGVRRHRWFEVSTGIALSPRACRHDYTPIVACGHTSSRGAMVRAMGIDWMSRYGLTQAIPPAYTEWIGKQVLAALQ